jgi:hypothetical protein
MGWPLFMRMLREQVDEMKKLIASSSREMKVGLIINE